jgi:hypothetical protein
MNILELLKLFVKKNHVYLLGFSFLLFLMIIRINSQNEDKQLNRRGVQTICKIYYSSWLVGQSRYFCKYYFFLKNAKLFGSETHYHKKCYVGDFYIITYLPDNPQINKIDLNQKILEKDVIKSFPTGNNPFEKDSTNLEAQ